MERACKGETGVRASTTSIRGQNSRPLAWDRPGSQTASAAISARWNALVRSGVVSRSSLLSGLALRSSVLVQGAVREGRGRVGRKRVVGKGALWDVRACTSLFGRGDDPRAQAPAGLLRAQLPQRRSALFRCLVRLSHPFYARHRYTAIVTPRPTLFLALHFALHF